MLIVGVHCRTTVSWPSDSWLNKLLTFGLDSSTVLFVFISGFLFQHLNTHALDYKDYLWKKLKYVLIPYAIVSIPAIVDKVFFEETAVWMTSFYQTTGMAGKIVFLLATGKHSGPFYFIPMIAIIYLLAPVLFRLQKTNQFGWAGPTMAFAGLFTYAYGYYANLLESLIYFLPVYIFGMWIGKYKDRVLGVSKYVIALLVFFYLTVLTLEMTGGIHSEHLQFFENDPHYVTTNFNLSKLKELTLAVVLLISFHRLKLSSTLLTTLGNYSFGIYFIHIYFINLIEKTVIYFKLPTIQNGGGYVLLLLFVITASGLCVWMTKKIFKQHSRLLVGS